MRAGRNDHVVRLDRLAVRDDLEPSVPAGHSVDSYAVSHRQREVIRVTLEVVGHLALRRAPGADVGERETGEAAEPAGREQPQGIPAPAPRIANVLVRIEDHEVAPELLELV